MYTYTITSTNHPHPHPLSPHSLSPHLLFPSLILLPLTPSQSPKGKLSCIVQSLKILISLLQYAKCGDPPGADDLFPVLVYILIKANPDGLLSTVQYIRHFTENSLVGEDAYWWAQFSTAVEFTKTLEWWCVFHSILVIITLSSFYPLTSDFYIIQSFLNPSSLFYWLFSLIFNHWIIAISISLSLWLCGVYTFQRFTFSMSAKMWSCACRVVVHGNHVQDWVQLYLSRYKAHENSSVGLV